MCIRDRYLFFGNAHAFVTYFYQHALTVYIVKTGFYGTVSVAVFDGVVYQVAEYPSYFFFICFYHERELASFFNDAAYIFFLGFKK